MAPIEVQMNYQFNIFANILTPMDIINAPLLFGEDFLTKEHMMSTTLTLQSEDMRYHAMTQQTKTLTKTKHITVQKFEKKTAELITTYASLFAHSCQCLEFAVSFQLPRNGNIQPTT